MLVKDQ